MMTLTAPERSSLVSTIPDIYVPSVPKHLKLTESMIRDFTCRPDLCAKVVFGEVMDAFQSARLKDYVWTPRCMDSSGFSSAKSRTFFLAFNIRCILIGNHYAGVYYQNFNNGQQVFWQYYDTYQRRSPMFRAQLGAMNLESTDIEDKGTKKGSSCWVATFRNGSKLFLPAPGFLTDSKSQAGLRFNDIGIDEWTKIEATGSTGIDDQLIGRCTRESFNQHHPFWCNHNLFLATAEDTLHPAYERYRIYCKRVEAGDPDYSVISYNFKDYSDLKMFGSRKSFKETLRELRTLKDQRAKWTKAKYLQEGLGIWSKNGRGWYEVETLDKCVALGIDRGLTPLIRRNEPGQKDNENVHYFLGADPSKGDKKKADDGALVLMRAIPIVEDAADNLGDWQLDFVWAYKVRKADATQWAALIHWKDQHFKYSGVMMDHGGGGIWIRPELAKSKQIINDQEKQVVPIVTLDDDSVAVGNYCLTMFSRSDDQIKRKWENLKGDDNLIDYAHSEFLEALERGIGFPKAFNERSAEEVKGWGDERKWANRLLDKAREQLAAISVATDDQGKWLMTSHNAKQFDARGKKDFAYACVHAYTRFLVWLKTSDREYKVREEDACGGE